MKSMLATAIAIASEAHKDQFDKGGMPYILHPLKVMHYLKSNDLELMCVAVLHDVVEDSDVTYDDLKLHGMSDRVISAVRILTKVSGETSADYLAKIKSNPDAIKVKMADLRHNSDIRRLKGNTEKDVARMKKYNTMYLELKDLA
jgi:(p)ppGpp synthase/HD superfamily hydrolase